LAENAGLFGVRAVLAAAVGAIMADFPCVASVLAVRRRWFTLPDSLRYVNQIGEASRKGSAGGKIADERTFDYHRGAEAQRKAGVGVGCETHRNVCLSALNPCIRVLNSCLASQCLCVSVVNAFAFLRVLCGFAALR
jgi:hypothetical protein